MPRTPDRRPGTLIEDDGINLTPDTVSPSTNGELRYVIGQGFRFFDEGTDKGLTGSGLTAPQHAALRQLIHLADTDGPREGWPSGVYQEVLGGLFPTSAIWWTSAAKITKIVEETVTYNANKTINTDQWKAYAADGTTVLATITDTWTYSGVNPTSRTRTIA